MSGFQIRNEVQRDELVKFSYPFDERSLLENEDIFIGTDLFLDAIFYLKDQAELPIHISAVDGTYGRVDETRFVFSDSNGDVVGSTAVDFNTEVCNILNNQGILTGVAVFRTDSLRRFIGQSTGQLFNLLPAVATFSLDVCHVTKTPHIRYLAVGDQAVFGNVRLIARHGVKWDVESDGALALGIVGDPPGADERIPIVSINGVRNRSIWLAGHPRLNLRIETTADGIRFIKAREDTTAT
jgi:hypothetical protein